MFFLHDFQLQCAFFFVSDAPVNESEYIYLIRSTSLGILIYILILYFIIERRREKAGFHFIR